MVRDIGVVLFEGFSLLTAGVISEVFQVANEICVARSRGDVLYDVRFYSAEGNVACSSSINVWTYACDARNAIGFDALFIVGGEGAQNAARDERVVGWLREVLPLSEVVKPIGEGRILIEAAGVDSSGQSCNTAGRLSKLVEALENDLSEEGDRYGPVVKTALMLVKRDLGVDVAREAVARLSLNGSPIVASVLSESSTPTRAEKVLASAQWLKENCGRPISVSEAVRVAAMSQRNFLRYFKQEIGVTPSEFLLQTRLEMTSRLLAETDFQIDRIARRCGWINGDRLAKIFRKRMGLTPSEYRMRIRGSVPGDPA